MVQKIINNDFLNSVIEILERSCLNSSGLKDWDLKFKTRENFLNFKQEMEFNISLIQSNIEIYFLLEKILQNVGKYLKTVKNCCKV